MQPVGYNSSTYHIPGYSGHIPRNHARRGEGFERSVGQPFGRPATSMVSNQMMMPMNQSVGQMMPRQFTHQCGDSQYQNMMMNPMYTMNWSPNATTMQGQPIPMMTLPMTTVGPDGTPGNNFMPGFEYYQQQWPQSQQSPTSDANNGSNASAGSGNISNQSLDIQGEEIQQLRPNPELQPQDSAGQHEQLQNAGGDTQSANPEEAVLSPQPVGNDKSSEQELIAVEPTKTKVNIAPKKVNARRSSSSLSSANAQGDYRRSSLDHSRSFSKPSRNEKKISTGIYNLDAPLPPSYAGHIPGFKYNSYGQTFGNAFTTSKQFIEESLYKNKKK